jgi:hypothetical protein
VPKRAIHTQSQRSKPDDHAGATTLVGNLGVNCRPLKICGVRSQRPSLTPSRRSEIQQCSGDFVAWAVEVAPAAVALDAHSSHVLTVDHEQ